LLDTQSESVTFSASWQIGEKDIIHQAIVNSHFIGVIGRKSGIIERKSDV
jgi:hypothetical protein